MEDFEAFTEMMGRHHTHHAEVAKQSIRRVTVLGGGDGACLLAALCLAQQLEVTLFTAYGHELDQLLTQGRRGSLGIASDGPLGQYQLSAESKLLPDHHAA